jgi:UDP-2-acetamido-3-amino-2,3-dideoxy-glucuronate N-acetyltransferase
MSFFAHSSAIIDSGARIGAGTKIWHFCHVSSGAEIGRNCSLGQNVFVADRVKIGDGVKIQNNVSIYAGVILEDYVFCGPSMVFTNVKTPRSAFPRNTAADFLTTRVRHGASIGANATIVCGTEVGAWALVAAGAVVTKDVLAHALVLGVPARQSGWVCQCGEGLTGKFEAAIVKCGACERSYRESGGRVELVEGSGGPA